MRAIAYLVVAGFVYLASAAHVAAASELPQQIDNSEFCQIISDMSDYESKFPFQLMSNEIRYQTVIPKLKSRISNADVYLGVGPEQNFTYIAALQPKIAFITDIRRDNMIEHLVYKAIFEMSANRSEFISHLFSRKPLSQPANKATARELFEAYAHEELNPTLFDQNLRAIKERVAKYASCVLFDADDASIESIYWSFFYVGTSFFDPDRGFILSEGNPIARIYADLMSATDDSGHAWGYLNSEENFLSVREMQLKNLIIPLVGDFAGKKTLPAIANYLKEHQAEVSVFYISNVEDSLFSTGDAWERFYTNAAEFPLATNSTIIRSKGARLTPPSALPGTNFITLLSAARDLIAAFKNGEIRSQEDVLRIP